jgi:hypothetical protein
METLFLAIPADAIYTRAIPVDVKFFCAISGDAKSS